MGIEDSALARTVLVVGGNGFLGGFIAAALRRRGWRVLLGVRQHGYWLREDQRVCDFASMREPQDWMAALRGVDAVVNAAGILREHDGQNFEAVHVDGPLALAGACVAQGVSAFVQVSALGHPLDGGFIASKHRFDAQLLQLPLRATVLRPSVVYAASGSYGGTSLLRALAGFPGFQWMPGDGRWLLQPVAAEDLGDAVAACVERGNGGIYELGGPEPLTLREYQRHWRRWLRIPGERVLRVPEWLVSLQVWLWERIGRGPVGETMWRMLRRGNLLQAGEGERVFRALGVAPRSLGAVLGAHPSQVQDRWQAQLYFLVPVLKLAVAGLWLFSAWLGWATPEADIQRLLADTPLAGWTGVALARGAGLLDLLLAAWLLVGWRPRAALAAMALCVLAYTLGFAILLPGLWLDPLGSLAKNLVILPALAVLWVLLDRR